GDVGFEAQALLNLGATSQRESDIGRAIRYFEGALALFARMGRRMQVRLTSWNLANAYIGVGQHEKARMYLEKSRRIAELENSDRGRAFVQFSEGDIAFDQGQFGQALASFENARDLFRKLGDGARVLEMTVKSGWAALELADLEAARRRVEELPVLGNGLSLADARQRAFRGAVAVVEATRSNGDASKGLGLVTRALDEFDRLKAEDDAWRTLAFLATCYVAQGDARSADACRQRARAIVARLGERLPRDLYKSLTEVVARSLIAPEERATTARDSATAPHDEPSPLSTAVVTSTVQASTHVTSTGPTVRKAEWDAHYPDLIGATPAILRVFDRLDRISRMAQATVLIRGESGTGKELVAAAVHRMSERKAGPFVRVNCAALVETLLMSELFGHEKGSFTGAFARKVGRFELARGGMIFLDEIGDISPKTQVSLLRVLQERSFERVGGTQTIHTDAAVICATHRDLEAMVREGSFREDLYYRLRGVVVELPPLRERPADIPLLARHFLEVAKRELGRAPTELARDAESVLSGYRWPGNIRELQNVIRSVALFCEGDVVKPEHLSEFPELFSSGSLVPPYPPSPPVSQLRSPLPSRALDAQAGPRDLAAEPPPREPAHLPAPAAPVTRDDGAATPEGLALGDLKRQLEFDAISGAMRKTGGNITRAAKLLKMKRPRLSQIVNGNPELKAIKEASRAQQDADAD
ncbi:MAG: sigma 54-interacting transcriptional regulator, partial [Myxococcota bacterium]